MDAVRDAEKVGEEMYKRYGDEHTEAPQRRNAPISQVLETSDACERTNHSFASINVSAKPRGEVEILIFHRYLCRMNRS
ncbi:hypothetical protein A3A38_02005 [Candidatus Kaiserbacteria bacterium RIFCSPLOWO2_01_FULL_53_17]|uniref:Uncharacterized protein n=1 Tax=Candidatus Kaiserbacteria bacterium RIFCSPLOWO2_01_FULL_53_17 TaxID=1798511 RepID=A0A1F6EFY2_9BACT|nr:MAG: hypothetical protein A3A38_02005 [Candidatus Kaiserbacteria bacterium RIFCSPLOWO2_01_FULL_53_17]